MMDNDRQNEEAMAKAKTMATERGMRYLARRAYGERELYEKLCFHCDAQSAAAAVAYLAEMGLVDDAAFAREQVDYLASRGKSAREIRHRLALKGVGRDVVDDALDGLELDETATALQIIQKKYRHKLEEGDKDKVIAALRRRGFETEDIRAAIKIAEEERDGL